MSDPHKQVREEPGKKYDDGKVMYQLIPWYPLEEVAKVYTYGAHKYSEDNWRGGMSWSRLFGAIMRHTWAWFRGEDVDRESGLLHLAHATFGLFSLMEYGRNRQEFDDRMRDVYVGINKGKEDHIVSGRDAPRKLRYPLYRDRHTKSVPPHPDHKAGEGLKDIPPTIRKPDGEELVPGDRVGIPGWYEG